MVETMSMDRAAADQEAQATLLLVDDEANILSALQRLFKPHGYRILTAGSGADGLEVMGRESVDLVISDMRMPEMDGAVFLGKIARRWPDTVRILLTGYADLSNTIKAINEGHIYRYISKPWEDSDLKLCVSRALEQKYLEREQRRLMELTRQQNETLKELRATLEAKVQSRTRELKDMYDMLQLAYGQLKNSYFNSIPVFANFVELGEGAAEGHGKRSAEMGRRVARALELDEVGSENVYVAGLLHDMGKLGLPDALVSKPYVSLTAEQRRHYEKHPVRGQAALMALEPLHDAALLIRHHHERYDGKGYPDQLRGDDIPIGARILAVVDDFDELQLGVLVGERMSEAEAREFLKSNRGHRYDPRVVDAFFNVLAEEQGSAAGERRVASNGLREGMVLTRDLFNDDGILLLSAGYQLSEAVIEKIRRFELEEGKGLYMHVRTD